MSRGGSHEEILELQLLFMGQRLRVFAQGHLGNRTITRLALYGSSGYLAMKSKTDVLTKVQYITTSALTTRLTIG